MYGPPRDGKGKFGREDKSAQMYSAFMWRPFLLAMMIWRVRCALKFELRPYKFYEIGSDAVQRVH
jgi:hypothetical protein